MFRDLTNQKFGKLTAIKVIGKNKKGESIWLCNCECGNQTKVICSNLRNGHTTSCGCYKLICSIKHNMLHSRLYRIWQGMLNRCRNANMPKYKIYGGRGIEVCDEWKTNFIYFYNWAIYNGYNDKLTIDRIDVNGNYEPNNCRWVNNKQQANNKRTNVYVSYNGECLTLKQWSEKIGIKQQTLSKRFRNFGDNLERLFYKGDLRYGTNR